MTEFTNAWFSAQFAPWLSLLSLFSLLSYTQYWANKGKHRQWVMGAYWGVTALGAVLALAGAYAYTNGQPRWVWLALLLAGGLLCGLMLWSTLKMAKTYDEAELRKTIASDM